MLQHYLTTALSKLAVNKTIEEYEKNQRENVSVLKPPKFALVIGAICMVIWAGLMIVVLLSSQDGTTITVCGIVFGILFALGLYLVLYERNFMVVYKDRQIIYRNLFRVTRKFDCQDIEKAYYTDGGGLKILFKDGKKLSFSKEESIFYNEVVQKERLKCKFKGEENPVIKVYLHPFLMWPFWIVSAALIVGSVFDFSLILYALIVLILCLGCRFSNTEYNKETKILTRRKFGFAKKYDMHFCSAKPRYEDGYLMGIEIYERNKKVARIPVSREYKNRARLAKALCGVIA